MVDLCLRSVMQLPVRFDSNQWSNSCAPGRRATDHATPHVLVAKDGQTPPAATATLLTALSFVPDASDPSQYLRQ